MTKHYIVRECSDRDMVYGILIVEGDLDKSDVQKAIKKIKTSFYDKDIPNWSIEDVLAELPFDCEFINEPGNLEV